MTYIPFIDLHGIGSLSFFWQNCREKAKRVKTVHNGEMKMLFTTVLKDNKAFLRCYKKGRFCADSFVAAYFYPNGSPYNRLGITAGKKQGCAVTRNRIKRIVRAAYRLNEAEFPLGYDIVFVGRNDIGEKKTQDIERFIKKRLIKEMNKPVPKNNRSGRAKSE